MGSAGRYRMSTLLMRRRRYGKKGQVVDAVKGIARMNIALLNRTTTPNRIVFTGSSTTEGLATTAVANRWVNIYTSCVQATYPNGIGAGTESAVVASTSAAFGTITNVVGNHGYNAGQASTTSGGTTPYLTAAERTAIAALTPSVIFHMVGSNDFSGNIDPVTFKANVLASINDFKSKLNSSIPCVQILVQSYERFDSRVHTYAWSLYGQALKEIADADPDNVVYIDVSAPFYAKGIPGATDAEAAATGLMATDKIHLNDAGHAFLADLILKATIGSYTKPDGTVVAGPGIVASDNFDRADAATLGTANTGEVWTPALGAWALQSGRAYATTAGTALLPAASRDISVEASVAYPTTGIVAVGTRATGSNNRVTAYIDAATSTFKIGVVINNTLTDRQTMAVPAGLAGTDVTIVLSTVGTTVNASINGTAIPAYTLTTTEDAALQGTDIAIRQTVAGFATSSFNYIEATATASSGGPTTPNDPLAMPVGNLPGWDQIMKNDFLTPVASPNFKTVYTTMATADGYGDTAWNASARNNGGVANVAGSGWYSNKTLSVSNSQLVIDVGWDAVMQKNLVANVYPNSWAGQIYGRVDFRMHMDNVSGYKVCPIWWSTRDVWEDGEIDFPESGSLGGTFAANVHKVNQPGLAGDNILHVDPVKNPTTAVAYRTQTDQVYSHRWTPTEISFWINNVKVASTTNQLGFPTHTMRFSFQIEAANLSGTTAIPQTNKGKVYIDWVTMYSYNSATL
jgi:lysophospholipase L1-like esterase